MGTRRVGKTFLLKNIKEKTSLPTILINGEDVDTQALLTQRSVSHYKRWLGGTQLLMIDEAQAVPDVGKALKLLIDELPNLTVIATGSSSFDLTNKTGEPLTGRKIHFDLFPLAQLELSQKEDLLQTRQALEERLVFGGYPEVVLLKDSQQKTEYLRDLVSSYLLKDILAYDQIRNSAKLLQLLQLIAFQVGSEVSYDELGKQLGMNKITIERYLDLLSKVFVLYRLGGFSSNLRKEVSKSSKWFFYDNGIRNAVINDFSLTPQRKDIGALWENYSISERIKRNSYKRISTDYFFWRTYDNQEIDFIERQNGKLLASEFKWSTTSKARIPGGFEKSYPDADYQVIHRDNYLDWIL